MPSNQELQMYGCDPAAFLDSVKASLSYKFSGGSMCVMSILSDAQELLAMGADNQARQQVNLAKMVLMEIADGKLCLNGSAA